MRRNVQPSAALSRRQRHRGRALTSWLLPALLIVGVGVLSACSGGETSQAEGREVGPPVEESAVQEPETTPETPSEEVVEAEEAESSAEPGQLAPGTEEETEAELAARAKELELRERELALKEKELELQERELAQRRRELQAQARAPEPAPPPAPPIEEPAERAPEVAEATDEGWDEEWAEETPTPAPEPEVVWLEVPAGREIEVEFLSYVGSDVSRPGDTFRTRVLEPVYTELGELAIPAGSEVLGQVIEAVTNDRRIGGRSRLVLDLTDLVLPSGATVPVDASFAEESESGKKKDAATIGGAAAARRR